MWSATPWCNASWKPTTNTKRSTSTDMLTLDLQVASESDQIPSEPDLKQWATVALREPGLPTEVTIRIVDEAESAELNLTYRNKSGPTRSEEHTSELQSRE